MQDDPLLQTKLFVPAPKSDLIQRRKLTDLLQTNFLSNGTFTRKLTLISAPAGYGKTTLASQWLYEAGLPISWLSLDIGDNDPTRFMTYLVAALQTIAPDIGHASLGMLQAPQQPPQERILTALINDLSSHGDPLLLVLDDYHVIQSQPVHEILNFIVEHLPINAHLVITSREDPPLPLHRLHARRQIVDVRQSELAFGVEDVLAFFQSISDVELSLEQAASLTQRTEGWVTGLQLAALSIKAAPDLNIFIESFTGSNRYILDYLFEEVFNQQSDEIKSFLLKTAILDRLCAGLADAITQRTDSHKLLEQLVHANFFIVPLDQTREWYRYHRLFSDLLRHRLNQSNYEVKHLHERASRWLAEHDFLDEAIEHALMGKLWEQAGEWIDQAGDKKLRLGELTTLFNWCRRMPEEVMLSRPDWGLTYAWPLILIGKTEHAGRVLRDIKHLVTQENGELQGQIAAAEAFLSRSEGDIERTITLSKQALSLLPEDDRSSRANVALNLGLITWHIGQLDDSETALSSALIDTKATRNHYAHHTALVFLGRTHASRGDLRSATLRLEEALEMGDQVPTAVLAHTDTAAILYEKNQLDSAWEHLERATAIAKTIRNAEFEIACHVQRTLFHLGLDDIPAAQSALEPTLALLRAQELPPPTDARLKACQVQLHLAAGDLHRAQEILASIPMEHDAQTYYRFIDLNSSRLQLAAGDRDRAQDMLTSAYKKAQQSGWGYAQYAIRVLQALAEEHIENAVSHLGPALRSAEEKGFLRIFLGEGVRILDILSEAARRGITPTYVGQILAAGGASATEAPGMGDMVETLTEREMEVLNLLAAGLSNRQIAEQLVVSLGTAKSHIHHIFGKLDVSSRMEAAARARELGLI